MEKLKNLARESSIHEILKIIDSFVEVQNRIKSSFIPQLPLELAIIKAAEQATGDKQQAVSDKINPKSQTSASPAGTAPQAEIPNQIPNFKFQNKKRDIQDTKYQIPDTKAPSDSNLTLETIINNWNKILVELEPLNHSLTALLLNCQPVKMENNTVTIAVKYKFYKERLNEIQNKLTIEKVLAKILGSPVKIKAVSEEEAGIKISAKQQAVSDKQEGKNSLLDEAMKIMGGKVVDE
jgi:DNA polymerase-3 subunit gamma/tau